jgi:hypothetical protein
MQIINRRLTRAGWVLVIALIVSIGIVAAALRLTVKFGATVVSQPITWQFIGVDNSDNIPIPLNGETTFWIKFTNHVNKQENLALYSTVWDVSEGKVWVGLYDNATGNELPNSGYGTNYKALIMLPNSDNVVKVVLAAQPSAQAGDYWIWGLNTGFSIYIDNVAL